MSYQIDELLNTAPCGFLSFIDDGTIVRINATLLQSLGYKLDEVQERKIESILPVASRIFYQSHFFPLLKLHGKAEEIYFSLKSKQGSNIPMLINGVRRQEEGNFVNDCIFIPIRQRIQYEDEILKAKKAAEVAIRAQKEAEIALRQQYDKAILLREITQRIRQYLDLKTIFDTASQEIRQFIHADRVGIFKFYADSNFNDGEFVAESVVAGFDSVMARKVHDHCFGQQYAVYYHQGKIQAVDDINDAGMAECHRAILAQFQIRANLIVPLLNGGDLWGLLCIHQCSAPRHWQESEIDFIQQIANQLAIAIQQAYLFEQVQTELTERRLTEAKLTETNKQLFISNIELARATRLKNEFLSNMSHELRTPLNSILGMSEAFLDRLFGVLTEKQHTAISLIDRSGRNLLKLINDILDFAKIESGKLELQMASTSVENLCNSSLSFVEQIAHHKNIQLTIYIPPHIDAIEVDEPRMCQVFINLLNNAVKFTPEGGRINFQVELYPIQNLIQFSITDTGIGIASEDIPKLFESFVQIDGKLNRQYEGTGLGLALVKRIVELHQGTVAVESIVGKGSKFTVNLPFHISTSLIQAQPNQPELVAVVSNSPTHIPAPQPVILLAEDNLANLDTFSEYLTARGYRMIMATNGQDAIALSNAQTPDLILMDIEMPDMDGLEAIQKLRTNPQLNQVPIVALTAPTMSENQEKCLDAGANEYIAKPVRMKQLVRTIQQLLAGKYSRIQESDVPPERLYRSQ
ncbi:MAG: response regulator [Nostocales cyanobacterium]|nr:MAG: response regulator [Nostocales cyanobacterium]